MDAIATVLTLLIAVVAGLLIWRWADIRFDRKSWVQLARSDRGDRAVFDPSMLDGLPEPARRYFLFSIKPGTELHTAVEIWMTGEMGLGNKQNPRYGPMQAHQILAPPYGLIWKVRLNQGIAQLTGSDGFCIKTSWTRFWLFGVVPLVRVGSGVDHARSAFGRVVAEAVFWAPAALLPGRGVDWEGIGEDTARVTMHFGGFAQAVDVTVDAVGKPVSVIMSRWSNANPDRVYRFQPFGGYLSNFKEFEGFNLPTCVEGGNFIGQESYFPFYKANVLDVRFASAR